MTDFTVPQTELAIINGIEGSMGQVLVTTRYPSENGEDSNGVVVITLLTGETPRDRVVVNVPFLVECWAAKENDARDIARKAWAKIYSLEGEVLDSMSINMVALNTPVRNPDPGRPGRSRFQFVGSIWTRLVPLTT